MRQIVDGAAIDTLKPAPIAKVLKTPEQMAEERKTEQVDKDAVSRSKTVQDKVQIRPQPAD